MHTYIHTFTDLETRVVYSVYDLRTGERRPEGPVIETDTRITFPLARCGDATPPAYYVITRVPPEQRDAVLPGFLTVELLAVLSSVLRADSRCDAAPSPVAIAAPGHTHRKNERVIRARAHTRATARAARAERPMTVMDRFGNPIEMTPRESQQTLSNPY